MYNLTEKNGFSTLLLSWHWYFDWILHWRQKRDVSTSGLSKDLRTKIIRHMQFYLKFWKAEATSSNLSHNKTYFKSSYINYICILTIDTSFFYFESRLKHLPQKNFIILRKRHTVSKCPWHWHFSIVNNHINQSYVRTPHNFFIWLFLLLFFVEIITMVL